VSGETFCRPEPEEEDAEDPRPLEDPPYDLPELLPGKGSAEEQVHHNIRETVNSWTWSFIS